jgi:S-disulfanyl-L-cysteine oxidoreductase SoxD
VSVPGRGANAPRRGGRPLPRAAFLSALLACGTFALSPAAAQQPPDTASVLEGVYTEAQALRGSRVFDRYCSLCHGPREFQGTLFQLTWAGQRLGALFTHISMTMPLDNPGHLTREQYTDVMAYMLELNGYPAGAAELPPVPEVLARIRLDRLPDSTRAPQPRDDR